MLKYKIPQIVTLTLKIGVNQPRATDSYLEGLQTKKSCIPLGISLLVCGPAWA